MAVVGWFGLPDYNEFFCSFGTLFVKDGGTGIFYRRFVDLFLVLCYA